MARESQAVPAWAQVLGDEDWQFLRRFLVASGSLKALAQEYGVSYPTVRARLDRLIAKVQAADEPTSDDPFERQVRVLVADGQLAPGVACALIEAHRAALKKEAR
jgi:hypothetical protein